MALVVLITILVYIILIVWTWHNLGFIEKTKKIAFIIIGILLTYIITQIIFQISKGDITYPNDEIAKQIRNAIVAIFSGINGLILMPIIAKNLDKINENEIEKEVVSKRFIIIFVIFIICTFIECGYMKTTQEGIINTYKTLEQEN